MEGQNEKKGLGKIIAGIRAFFSRKNKKDDVASEQENVILEQNSVVVDSEKVTEVTEDNVDIESISVNVDENIEANLDAEAIVDTNIVADNSVEELSEEDLTPQQEYVASKNIRVTATATTIRSFIAKVSMINDEAKKYYSDLKNFVLSYEGTRTRLSWQYESFYKTKTLIARMAVRGRSLWIYLPIDIQAIPQGINCVEINDKKYKGLKSGLYIQGERTFKQAKRLLTVVCDELGLKQIDREYVDYIPPVMSEEEMLEKNLIRKIQTSTNAVD